MGTYNALVGSPPTATADPPMFGAGGMADRHPMTGGAGATTRNNPPLTLALIVLGSVAVLGALNLAGFRGTIAVGRA